MSVTITSSWAVDEWKNTGTTLPPADLGGALCRVQRARICAAQNVRRKISGSTQEPTGWQELRPEHMGLSVTQCPEPVATGVLGGKEQYSGKASWKRWVGLDMLVW